MIKNNDTSTTFHFGSGKISARRNVCGRSSLVFALTFMVILMTGCGRGVEKKQLTLSQLQQRFNDVSIGMSYDDVIAKLGTPTTKGVGSFYVWDRKYVIDEIWHYEVYDTNQTGLKVLEVGFYKGKVTWKNTRDTEKETMGNKK